MESCTADKLYMLLNAAELEAINKRDSPSLNDRDAGFCSASSESEGGDDLTIENLSERTILPVAISIKHKAFGETPVGLLRNKRKSIEPTKVVEPVLESNVFCESSTVDPCLAVSAPPKKRIRYSSSVDSAVILTPPDLQSPSHISQSKCPTSHVLDFTHAVSRERMPSPAHIFLRHPGVTTLHRSFGYGTPPEQSEPLALITRKSEDDGFQISSRQLHNLQSVNKSLPDNPSSRKANESSKCGSIEDLSKDDDSASLSKPQQRNYKNMTRERRIEANARERTRVHTISAAYETLRRAVPAYASSQKLSKLSVLRVACSYILTLSRMAGRDYSHDQSEPTIADCIEAINSTIQTEGKIKRKKDE